MIRNVLLIVAPNAPVDEISTNKKFNIKLRKEIPLGVLSIAAYLKKNKEDLTVKIIDLNIVFSDLLENHEMDRYANMEAIFSEALNCGKNEEEWLIGVSAIFNTTYPYLQPISEVCRKLYPNSFRFTGGGLPSNLYETVLNHVKDLDAVCVGEGEIPILELLLHAEREEYLKTSNCWMIREKLGKPFQKEFKYIEDLDEIPPLDFELLDYEKYSNHAHGQTGVATIAAPLMFSRGCPFNCCFCASHSIHGKRIRYNSMQRIQSDIKRMVDRYAINTITVWDDNFFVNKEQALQLLDYFVALNLKIEFVNGFPVYRMDDEMAKSLKTAGVDVVTLAIESGNDRVLKDIIHKPLRLDMVEKAVDCLRANDMYIKGLFVIGLPGETLDDIEVTMEFIRKIPLNWVDIFIASPVAGSELYAICKENGYVSDENLENYNFWQGSIETPEFSPEQIQEIQLFHILQKDFVENYDMLHQNYERALINFEYVIHSNGDNPFAFYYAAMAAEKLQLPDKMKEYRKHVYEITEKKPEWKTYFDQFSIVL